MLQPEAVKGFNTLLHEGVANVDTRKRMLYEPRREKTGFLHMRKQKRRPASR